jgi:tetratricopeptide (TPR) repeat protein
MVHCDAVRLFVDRALAAQPQFRLTADNAAAVTEICRRLDGIPLALELAAARLRALPVEGIATRLQDRFRLLVAGDRTALPRQKTLRALIDWSHDLLTDAERVVFRRLAVFAGGFTLEAAEAVVPGSDLADGEVLDLLTQLVDKSLVAVAVDAGRYRLLETVRQYAGECLAATGDGAGLRARHLAHYVALAEKARPELVGPHQAEWLARLDLDRENLLSAHAGCAADPQAGATGLQLVTALKQYFYRRGLLGLAQHVMAEALAHPGAQARDAERSRALFSIGQICLFAGRYPEALGYLEECLAIARETGDRRRVASVLQPLGAVLSAQGDLAGARRCHDEAIVLAREFGSRRDLAAALNNRAQLHRLEGEPAAAQPLYRDVLQLVQGEGDREGVAIALLNLAMLEIARGAAAPAVPLLEQALVTAAETGSRPASQCVVDVAAGLATLRGDYERAARLHGVAAAQAAQTGLQRDAADEAFLAPLVARARAGLPAGAFAAAEAAGREQAFDATLAELRAWLAPGAGPPPAAGNG